MKSKPETFYPVKFLVMGSGKFPIDMLRYDRCVPSTEGDANAIAREADFAGTIGLTRFSSAGRSGPCIARWKSFGWTVGRIEYSDGTVEYGPGISEAQKEGLDFRAGVSG